MGFLVDPMNSRARDQAPVAFMIVFGVDDLNNFLFPIHTD